MDHTRLLYLARHGDLDAAHRLCVEAMRCGAQEDALRVCIDGAVPLPLVEQIILEDIARGVPWTSSIYAEAVERARGDVLESFLVRAALRLPAVAEALDEDSSVWCIALAAKALKTPLKLQVSTLAHVATLCPAIFDRMDADSASILRDALEGANDALTTPATTPLRLAARMADDLGHYCGPGGGFSGALQSVDDLASAWMRWSDLEVLHEGAAGGLYGPAGILCWNRERGYLVHETCTGNTRIEVSAERIYIESVPADAYIEWRQAPEGDRVSVGLLGHEDPRGYDLYRLEWADTLTGGLLSRSLGCSIAEEADLVRRNGDLAARFAGFSPARYDSRGEDLAEMLGY